MAGSVKCLSYNLENLSSISRSCSPHLALPSFRLVFNCVGFGVCAAMSNDKSPFWDPEFLSVSTYWPSLNSLYAFSCVAHRPSKAFLLTAWKLHTPGCRGFGLSQVVPGLSSWLLGCVFTFLPFRPTAIYEATASDTGWQLFSNSTFIWQDPLSEPCPRTVNFRIHFLLC